MVLRASITQQNMADQSQHRFDLSVVPSSILSANHAELISLHESHDFASTSDSIATHMRLDSVISTPMRFLPTRVSHKRTITPAHREKLITSMGISSFELIKL